MSTVVPENRILAALPAADLARVLARTTEVSLGKEELLYRAGGPIDFVYFPRVGTISAIVIMDDGASTEVATTGREGVVGGAAALGARVSAEQVFCQVHPATCRKLPTAGFVAEVARGGALRDLVYRYLRATLTASARQTACSALHSVDARCARWLLQCHDACGTDEFPLTHEFLALVLGVHRAAVNPLAEHLQNSGLIRYAHGRMTIVDRARLEGAACECYAAIRAALGISVR
ncbi:Crp/Fnr family transcriptional regulator [Frigoriglobus tundricola]|uniref:Cyclic nucleotide-binding domain-containing protein n=1 Tax=Frigoriglobus tundricola TaxID=2774151 RepID=A0A6M5Z6L6_9BACT|nr:Crp/Fnr family transcriptional regulator [Frigoriglobus tundricola]QJX00873.1 hypothetical protein FTUN_8511 [Frigoriglobus tundricola]